MVNMDYIMRVRISILLHVFTIITLFVGGMMADD